jgi:phosphoserine phosphatase
MTSILVLIANPAHADLHDSTVRAACDAAARHGAAPGNVTWLAPAIAAEIPVDNASPEARSAVAASLEGTRIDVAFVPAAARRKRLLVADMESTLIENEFLDDLGARAGLGHSIAEITTRAMNGQLDFAGALRERVAMLRGRPAALLEETFAGLRIMPGAKTLIATMRTHGAVTAIVSGGFRIFAERVRAALGADLVDANELELDGATLAGTVREPVFDRLSKRATLERLTAKHGLTANDSLAVGDGANDLEMVRTAGLGVAFHAKKILAEAAHVSIRHGDLTALLYLQGYKKSEFAG